MLFRDVWWSTPSKFITYRYYRLGWPPSQDPGQTRRFSSRFSEPKNNEKTNESDLWRFITGNRGGLKHVFSLPKTIYFPEKCWLGKPLSFWERPILRCYCWWFRNPKQAPGRYKTPLMKYDCNMNHINWWTPDFWTINHQQYVSF